MWNALEYKWNQLCEWTNSRNIGCDFTKCFISCRMRRQIFNLGAFVEHNCFLLLLGSKSKIYLTSPLFGDWMLWLSYCGAVAIRVLVFTPFLWSGLYIYHLWPVSDVLGVNGGRETCRPLNHIFLHVGHVIMFPPLKGTLDYCSGIQEARLCCYCHVTGVLQVFLSLWIVHPLTEHFIIRFTF